MLGKRVARTCPQLARHIHLRSIFHREFPASVRTCHLQFRQCANHAGSASTSKSNPTSKPLSLPDHRDIGVKQELFTTSPYSPGSPIFLPAGARIFNRLVEYLRKKYVKYGFQEVITPTIYKKALWAKSGHLENYAEDMFTVTSTSPSRRDPPPAEDDGSRTAETEEDEYGLKPMNCPGHCLIFNAHRHSYRDLPIRYADFSPLHRNEISGALSGLTRVRRFHQDDGHIFCRPSQIEQEIRQTLAFVAEAYKTFRLGPYRLVLSTRPEEQFIGTLEEWDQAESALKGALEATGQPWTLNKGDGAFYGPKIDIILKDSDGKEHQTATIQLDFQLPKRFELEYEAPAPELEQRGLTTTDPEELAIVGRVRPVMIHRAVLGSVERLMALLIEQYNGKWPFWLNPRQVAILTVNDTQQVLDLARSTQTLLLGTTGSEDSLLKTTTAEAVQNGEGRSSKPVFGLAVDVDDSARTVGVKVREAKTKGYGIIVVVGPRNLESGKVDVNASGIPVLKDLKGDAKMTPNELLEFVREHIDAYD
ncbi:threonyl-tRNA synthetase [Gnomoniopsis sp. IMI 355080]|nr:threonyl-tRNA synthetase [Gnomoniopsis sp. IMI 355080]